MKYFLRRTLAILLVLWLTVILSFIALRLIPTDAIRIQLAQSGADESLIDEQRSQLGLDKPVWVQYTDYLWGLLQGDFGESIINGLPVSTLISQRLQPTAMLAFSSLIVAITSGIALGIVGGLNTPHSLSITARLFTSLLLSVPIYWTGTLVIFLFTLKLNGGNLLVPALLLGLHSAGGIARILQAGLRDIQEAPFVTTAYAKGLPHRYVLHHHILRASLLPVFSIIALQAGFLMGGTVITESIFRRPGIGQLLLDATMQRDYPVVQGIVLLSAIVYTLLNLIADIASRFVDPRIA